MVEITLVIISRMSAYATWDLTICHKVKGIKKWYTAWIKTYDIITYKI